ncbi:hypothetical protein LCGC14_3104390, partial [marine sediment metagenome]
MVCKVRHNVTLAQKRPEYAVVNLCIFFPAMTQRVVRSVRTAARSVRVNYPSLSHAPENLTLRQ